MAKKIYLKDFRVREVIDIIPNENLDTQIGTVKKQVTSSPKNDGEANECQVGTKIFSIKGVDTKEAIAVNLRNEYHRAIT